MLICGPITPNDPKTAAIVADGYLRWIAGERKTPPAPLRNVQTPESQKVAKSLQTPASVAPHLAPRPKGGDELAGLLGDRGGDSDDRRRRRRDLTGTQALGILATLASPAADELVEISPPPITLRSVRVSSPPGAGPVIEPGRATPRTFAGRNRKETYIDVYTATYDPRSVIDWTGYPYERRVLSAVSPTCYEVPEVVGDPIPPHTFPPSELLNLTQCMSYGSGGYPNGGAVGIETWRNLQIGVQSNVEGYFAELEGRVELALDCFYTANFGVLGTFPIDDTKLIFVDLEVLQPWTDWIEIYGGPTVLPFIGPTPQFTTFADALKNTRPFTNAMPDAEFQKYARREYLTIVKRYYDTVLAGIRRRLPNAIAGIYAAPINPYQVYFTRGTEISGYAAALSTARSKWLSGPAFASTVSILRGWDAVMGQAYFVEKVVADANYKGDPWTASVSQTSEYLDNCIRESVTFADALDLPYMPFINGQTFPSLANPHREETVSSDVFNLVWSRLTALKDPPPGVIFFSTGDVTASPLETNIAAFVDGVLSRVALNHNYEPAV